MTVKERNENITGNNKEIESKLVLADQENGIFTAPVFSIILQRLVNLHRKLQKEISKRKLKELTDLQSAIAQHLKNLDREEDEEARKEKIQVIEEARQELTQEAENYERAKKVRIDHYYMDNNGKNKAASFIPVKETRKHNSIRKIKVSEEEETNDITKIVKILE